VKKNIHPAYREVVFTDVGANHSFMTRSCVQCDSTVVFEGKEYPQYKLDISSASHPFFTGKMKFLDTTGRVERFQKKYKGGYGKK
jgi:large subunit ribosomal protein L31